ncbi:ADP-heptose:LPS heptosyltransferase [Parafrankia irregularis]|uniref:ADP-heptose:LPS heptosyltransferase n=1 Tax=Parafrankia irregularis TaxID=795642 RepID=A0A0S4QMT5_9ACTN|nr:glycosyltransferase family 9 protein [Parafrankia sp. CH37]CUU56216.1 ADP-heptose:LPS heptosyltransferase [Parafrankia irregularis]
MALRALGLGDLLTALPALRGLRRHLTSELPGHRLLLAGPAWLEPVAMLSGAVDGLVPTDPLAPVAVAAPTLAVNLHGRGPESTQTLRRTRPAALWAFDLPGGCAWEPPDLAQAGSTTADPGSAATGHSRTFSAGTATGYVPGLGNEHEVSRWCRLLAAHGVSCDPTELGLPVPPWLPPVCGWARNPTADRGTGGGETQDRGSEPGPTVVHPGGAAPARRWPELRWAAVARQLAQDGHQIVFTGSSAEHGLALRVATAAGLPPSTVLAGKLDLVALCALVARARLVLSADTGVAHLATAYRRPSVVLFGPVSPAEWGPPFDRPKHRALWAGQHSDPRGGFPAPGLLALTVDQVLREVTLLKQGACPTQ